MNLNSRILVLLAVVGCGTAQRDVPDFQGEVEKQSAGASAATAKGSENGAIAGKAVPGDRKLIYVAEIALVVDDFAAVESAVPNLVRQFDGYLAEAAIHRQTGSIRSGQWIVRVPIDRFDAFLDDVAKLGVPESRRQTAQDVTEEFVDLEARINNSKRVEEEILKLLADRTANIKDVLAVQARLGEVRGEIERMQGRLKFLQNRTAMATVTIQIREERGYQPAEMPGFANRVGRAWLNSVDSLRTFLENAAVSLIFAAPWIFFWMILFLPAVWYVRYRWKKRIAG
jgi:hypothetical protein